MAVSETIQEILQGIDDAQYGRDMRDYIHKGIQKCYEEGSAGETDLVAREEIEEIRNDMLSSSLPTSVIHTLEVTSPVTAVSGECYYYTTGTSVVVHFNGYGMNYGTNYNGYIRLPEGYRPYKDTYFIGFYGSQLTRIEILENGYINMLLSNTTSGGQSQHLCYECRFDLFEEST